MNERKLSKKSCGGAKRRAGLTRPRLTTCVSDRRQKPPKPQSPFFSLALINSLHDPSASILCRRSLISAPGNNSSTSHLSHFSCSSSSSSSGSLQLEREGTGNEKSCQKYSEMRATIGATARDMSIVTVQLEGPSNDQTYDGGFVKSQFPRRFVSQLCLPPSTSLYSSHPQRPRSHLAPSPPRPSPLILFLLLRLRWHLKRPRRCPFPSSSFALLNCNQGGKLTGFAAVGLDLLYRSENR